MIRTFIEKTRSFKEDKSGAAMVEFAIALPILLLVLAIIVEGSRIAYAHQAAASGVRDASRYIARLASDTVCDTADVAGANTALQTQFGTEATNIVSARLGDPTEAVLPGGVTIQSVTPALRCRAVDYSTADVSVVEVTVTLEIEFIFGGVFDIFGDELEPLTTQIADQSRVFGI